jgi:rhodanese-related sulfurtransferase
MTPEKLILDVREPDEFTKEHVPGSINLPLSRIEHIHAYKAVLKNKPVMILCGTGKRAQIAKGHLDHHQIECEVIEGGIKNWKEKGNPVLTYSSQKISIFRQVQIVVGLFVVILSLLSYFVAPVFGLLAALIGMMLAIAGIFGFCLLATLLSKMPWNKVK